MTERYNALIVVLERDTRSDDAELLMAAIRMLRGVISVQGNVASLEEEIATQRVRHELGKKLLDVCFPQRKKGGE